METQTEWLDILALLVSVIVQIGVPIFLAWYGRQYANDVRQEKRLGNIVRLANMAIDYAEDLDKRGVLSQTLDKLGISGKLAQDASRGLKKLNIAGDWLERELKRANIKVSSDQDVKDWIAAEFQNRLNQLPPATRNRLAEMKALLERLVEHDLIIPPQSAPDLRDLSHQLTDWLSPEMEGQTKKQLEGEVLQVLTKKLASPQLSVEAQLAQLAQAGRAYLDQAKANHRPNVADADLVRAWLVLEMTKREIPIKSEPLETTVERVLGMS